jgi:osmotically-inducible protein OsmY
MRLRYEHNLSDRPCVIALGLCAGFALLGSDADATDDRVALSDAAIEKILETQLREEFSNSAHVIHVDVVDGVAILSGMVEDIHAEDRAISTAGESLGILSVIDQLTVERGYRYDAVISIEIEHALESAPATKDSMLEASVTNGAVTLRGKVATSTERALATRITKTVPGVRSVLNLIDVDAASAVPEVTIERNVPDVRD